MRRKNRNLVALGIVGALGVGAWLAAPRFVRWYVGHRFAGVTAGSAEISMNRVSLFEVDIERPGIKAHFKRVVVTPDEAMTVDGGTIDVDVDAMKKGAGGSEKRRKISGHVDSVHVKKGAIVADAYDATVDEDHVCFETAHIAHDLGVIDVTGGCATTDRSSITARHVAITPKIHIPIPGLREGTIEPIVVEGVELQPLVSKGHARRITYRSHTDTSTHSWGGGANGLDVQLDGRKLAVSADEMDFDLPLVYHDAITVKKVAVGINLDARDDFDVKVGGVTAHVRPNDLAASGDETCQGWLDALPQEMRVGPLASLQYDGRLSVSVQVKPKPRIEIKSSCKARCEPLKDLRSSFSYLAYDAKGKSFPRTSGPRTADWTPISAMSPLMPQAAITLEDPGFHGHHGFMPEAFENSLKADLEASKFVRGGSTITMQLAKNLWLRRNKALGRKVQEVLLSIALESCLSKDEIVETYLNVVEFGPDLYGIGPASRHYFGEPPMSLDAVQAFYLASILPAPKKAPMPTEDVLDRIKKLMVRLAANGNLPDGMIVPEEDLSGPVDTAGWEVTP